MAWADRDAELLGAVLMGAIFAKMISTANNFLFSPATNLVNDIFLRYLAPEASNKRILAISRFDGGGAGCWALYQSLNTDRCWRRRFMPTRFIRLR